MDIFSQEGAGTRIRIEVPRIGIRPSDRQLSLTVRKQIPAAGRPEIPLLSVISAARGFFAVLVDVLDHLLVNEQVGASEARQL